MSIPELTPAQEDAAALARAIEILVRLKKSRLVGWYLQRIVRELNR